MYLNGCGYSIWTKEIFEPTTYNVFKFVIDSFNLIFKGLNRQHIMYLNISGFTVPLKNTVEPTTYNVFK